MSSVDAPSKILGNKCLCQYIKDMERESRASYISTTPKYRNPILDVEKFLGESKMGAGEATSHGEINLCIVTFGRFQPPHLGHIELLDINSTISEYINLKYPRKYNCQSYAWLSSNLLESGLFSTVTTTDEITEMMGNLGITGTTNRGRMKRILRRERKKKTSDLKNKEPLKLNEKLGFILKMTNYDKNLHYLVDQPVEQMNIGTMKEKDIKFNMTKLGEDNPSGHALELLKKAFKSKMERGRTVKIIFVLGSDRVEAFKKYNNANAESLFGKRNFTVIQAGDDRGSAGEGGEREGESKDSIVDTSVSGKYSGTTLRESIKEITYNNNKIPQTDDNKKRIEYILRSTLFGSMTTNDVLTLINLIRKSVVKKDIEWTAFNTFIMNNAEFKNIFNSPGGGKRKTRKKKRKKKRKRCSKKRLKKKMICHRGSKKKLRKLRKLTKKLKLRLTRGSKKRFKKWTVKKSRKKR
jgi:nicotinic acid mononucleotide adenylyltransferase